VIWKLDAYRSALFLLHVARADVRIVGAIRLYEEAAAQMIRAVGSVSANIGEGYSRATRADRLRILGYALSSVRECVTWYLAATDVLDEATVESRLVLCARNRALLLGLIRSIRERGGPGRDLEP
jgi:four helix bundle protein